MADPKYANLYGIAHDQPDVYETNDLPEADQPDDIFEENCESIERLHLSTSEAFTVFQDKKVDASSVDFSDNIGNLRKYGYNVRDNWKLRLQTSTDDESLIQKYNRLKQEAEYLAQDINNFSKNTQNELLKVSDKLAVSADEANELLTQISDLRIENCGYSNYMPSVTEAARLMTLINDLDKYKEKFTEDSKHESSVSEPVPVATNSVEYVLTLNPTQKSLLTLRISDLEQKINKLEVLIGSNTKQAARLCNMSVDDGLINCCQWMIAKLSLLDYSQLEAIESKVNSVSSRIEQCLSSQQSIVQESEKDKKIHELYEIANKVKEKSELVPSLLQRMIALQTLHLQAKQFVQTVAHLENLQSSLSTNLANNEVTLNNLRESLKSNMVIIKENVESLKSRIEKLSITEK